MPPPGPARSRGAQRRGQLRCHLRERRWGSAQGPAEPRAGAGRTGTRTGLWTWPPSPPSLPPPPSGAGRAWPGGSGGGRGLCGPFPLGVRERLSLPGREAERRGGPPDRRWRKGARLDPLALMRNALRWAGARSRPGLGAGRGRRGGRQERNRQQSGHLLWWRLEVPPPAPVRGTCVVGGEVGGRCRRSTSAR